jgi:L-ribulose-5-phosphate 3-epimerase
MLRRQLIASLAAAPMLSTRAFGANHRIDLSRIAVLTDEVAESPEAAIAFAKQYGVKLVELRGVPGQKGQHYGKLSDAQLKEAAKQFSDNGLKVSFLNTGFFKITLPGSNPTRRKETPEKKAERIAKHQADFGRWKQDLQDAIRSAHAFNVDQLRVFTFLRVPEPEKVFQQTADAVGEMVELAAKDNVRVLVENEGSCNVATSAEMAGFMKLLPQRTAGINWDPLNGMSEEKPYPEGYNLLPKKRIWNVQIKGHSLLDPAKVLDWRSIFASLDRDGFKGNVGLETHYFDGTRVEKSHASMKEIKRILES